MIKPVLLLFGLFAAQISFAQIYLGFTENEIQDHIQKSYTKGREVFRDGTTVLTILFKGEESHYVRRYFFSGLTNRCFLYILEPVSQESLITFVKFCNEHYVTLGPRKWRTYVNGLTTDVELKYNQEVKQNFFFFTPVSNSVQQP